MRFRVTVIQVLEYDAVKSDYPSDCTPAQMLGLDFDNLRDDPDLFMSRPGTVTTYRVENTETHDSKGVVNHGHVPAM